jgi:hypothetical protein
MKDAPKSTTKRCQECGGRVPIQAHYCIHCGGDLWLQSSGNGLGDGERSEEAPRRHGASAGRR